MRPCNPTLAAALADPTFELDQADLFTVTLVDGTQFFWTSFDRDIPYGIQTFTSSGPFMRYSDITISNTMSVPTLEINLLGTINGFNGGLDIMSQAHNGLFDGAMLTLNRLYLPRGTTDTSLGTITLFDGLSGPVEVDGLLINMKIKGANNLLDQYAPRVVYQASCVHAFCDSGCTLLRSDFTTSYVVGAAPAPSAIFVPWASAPASPELYDLGTITFTSGAASGSRRNIDHADGTGIYFMYPLYNTPSTGDSFDAFQGCTKTQTICTSRSNIQNWEGFPYTPPATTGI